MKRILLYITLCLFLCSCVSITDENGEPVHEKTEKSKKKKPVIDYAIQYTIEFNDATKTVTEHVKVDTDYTVGLFYHEDEKEGINRLTLKGENGYYRQEICATRYRISSYGISYWEKTEE